MTTFTVHPKRAPQVLVGDLDILSTQYHSYMYHDHEVDREAERTFANRLSSRGYGVKVLEGKFDERFSYYERQYSTRTFYHNYTAHTATILERNGVPMVFQPDLRRSGIEEPGIVIRKEFFFDTKVTGRRTLEALRANMPLQGKELNQFKETLHRHCADTGIFGAMIATEYFIREEEIENAERAIYHQKSDVVISFNAPAQTPAHPASAEYVETVTALLAAPIPRGDFDISLILRYVSDDPAATPKYMRFANKVFTLKPEPNHPSKLLEVASREKSGPERKLEERGEYIEFVYPAAVDTGNAANKSLRVMRIGIDEAQSMFGVFDNFQDINDPREVLEATNRKLKDKLDFEGQERQRRDREAGEKLTGVQREYEDKLLSAQVTLRQREEEITELKRGQAVRIEAIKESRDREAHRQKVTFENVKFAMNIVTVLVGLLPLFLKMKSSAK